MANVRVIKAYYKDVVEIQWYRDPDQPGEGQSVFPERYSAPPRSVWEARVRQQQEQEDTREDRSMTSADLGKAMQLLGLIMAGVQVSQTLKGSTGEQKKQAVKDFVTLGEAGTDLFKPGLLNHQAVDLGVDHAIEAIVNLAHAVNPAAQVVAASPAKAPASEGAK